MRRYAFGIQNFVFHHFSVIIEIQNFFVTFSVILQLSHNLPIGIICVHTQELFAIRICVHTSEVFTIRCVLTSEVFTIGVNIRFHCSWTYNSPPFSWSTDDLLRTHLTIHPYTLDT